MPSRPQRKNATPRKSTATVAKAKSAPRGRPRNAKKNEKVSPPKQPSPPPPPILPEPSSEKKETPLQQKVRTLVQEVEQVEYYPDKLKRALTKKTFLKAKPNFKIVAVTNKRKLSVPQRQGSSLSQKRQRSPSPELSMAAMVRMMEEKNALSDEDFMEILTCASPVWWEDPPHPLYIEEPICQRAPSPPSSITPLNNPESHRQTPVPKPSSSQNSSMDFEGAIEEFKQITLPNKSGKFVKKQQKLESILGNIKTVKNSIKESKNVPTDKNVSTDNNVSTDKNVPSDKNVATGKNRCRKISNSISIVSDGDLSDLSLNEEEVLKNLESMEIPIKQQEKVKIEIQGFGKYTNSAANAKPSMKHIKIPDILPPLTRKPIRIENKMRSENSDSNSDYFENISHSNFRFISDDDISLVDISENTDKVDISSIDSSPIVSVGSINIRRDLLLNTDICKTKTLPKKVANDQTEYITVYKIMTNDDQNENQSKTKYISNNEIENVKGKLNSFFKKCKNNKRLKKSESPAIPVTAVSNLKSISKVVTDENRLTNCDCEQNGTNNTSCICGKDSGFKCSLCNFHTDTKEVYTNHLSSCKVMVTMPWNRSYLINQT